MQDEGQFEQLMLQYEQLKNSSEDISKMIDREDFDSAITMLNSRQKIFMNCKCMLRYLELTPVQKNQYDKIIDELRTLELKNIKKLEKSMQEVQNELIKSQKSQKIQNAYENSETQKGSIINIEE